MMSQRKKDAIQQEAPWVFKYAPFAEDIKFEMVDLDTLALRPEWTRFWGFDKDLILLLNGGGQRIGRVGCKECIRKTKSFWTRKSVWKEEKVFFDENIEESLNRVDGVRFILYAPDYHNPNAVIIYKLPRKFTMSQQLEAKAAKLRSEIRTFLQDEPVVQ